MFATLSVKELKKLIADYKAFHDIKNYHKMKKAQLVKELERRFVLKGDKLHMKEEVDSDDEPILPYTALEDPPPAAVVVAPAPEVKKAPRRIIAPILIEPERKLKRLRPVRLDEVLSEAKPAKKKLKKKQIFK